MPERGVTLTDLEHAVGPLRDDLDQIARDLGEVRRGVNRLLAQGASEGRPGFVRDDRRPTERSTFGSVAATPTTQVPFAAAPVGSPSGRTAASATTSATEEDQPLQDVIIANFDCVDRESGRNHAMARTGFLARMGNRVKRIEFVDNAVVFYQTADTAYVHPWPNQRLGQTWLSHFRLSRGSNYPVLSLEALALARERENGEWECLQKGYAKNDD